MTVIQRQSLLKYLGGEYDPGAVDGLDGPKTQAAMDRIKRDYGVGEDGLVGIIAGTVAKKASDKTSDKEPGEWWADIRHFSREEFRCKCGGRYCNGYPAEMCETVVRIADAARDHFKSPAQVISGLRCAKWNAHEGGVENSQHCSGEAIDLYIAGVPADTLRKFVAGQPGHRYSYNINSTNVHFDVPRGSK